MWPPSAAIFYDLFSQGWGGHGPLGPLDLLLESPYYLMAFCLKNFVARTYKSLFYSKMNAASVVLTCEVVGTLNHYKMVEKILNFVHLEVMGR